MDFGRHQVLPNAAFASDEDFRVAGGGASRQLYDFGEPGAGTDNVGGAGRAYARKKFSLHTDQWSSDVGAKDMPSADFNEGPRVLRNQLFPA
ncbi:MAG: hypothetical protein LC753_13325 [Acidobacteria bacterium]|nr:hypothetical protein [Acidobacteriota bacterium]MCA1651206.1 hypothetical protein [Acidobacteriota bacterium]